MYHIIIIKKWIFFKLLHINVLKTIVNNKTFLDKKISTFFNFNKSNYKFIFYLKYKFGNHIITFGNNIIISKLIVSKTTNGKIEENSFAKGIFPTSEIINNDGP